MISLASVNTAYDMLIYTIEHARTLTREQKDDYLGRLRKGEWNDALRLEFLDLCKREAALRQEDISLRKRFIRDQDRLIAERHAEGTAEQTDMLEDYDGELKQIEHDFADLCETTERKLENAVESSAKKHDSADIDAIRASLKQEE